MGKKNLVAIGVLFIVLLGAIFVTLFLISSNQDTRSGAQTPDVFPTAPPFVTDIPVDVQDGEEEIFEEGDETGDPGPVDGVSVNHPYVSGDTVDYTQASCTWDANQNASEYTVKVTEVDSGTVVRDITVSSETLESVISEIVSGSTYRCEVAAVNASGVVGVAGVDEQVCEIPVAAVPTITSPPVVTNPPVSSPSATPIAQIPTSTPILPPTGSISTIATVGIGGIFLLLVGGALLFL